ncbi:DMT family transporter [Arthrobacter woluwensis]|uniref:Threonine/homoserine efflux transporter RhtA n=1 Tax=Arthrobacter woluwensis TaxID=156980 RepID=A0A1H4MG16_9MICC|nr:DMT family transporter [Arthrobacter woluwensis]SEB82060.1 Threonine/homoserine efflux transporter RhtA [Arthrobacter woluwensis]
MTSSTDLSSSRRQPPSSPTPRSAVLRAKIWLALAMAGWGTIGVFSIQAGTDPITTVAWRCVFASGALLLLALATDAFRKSTWTVKAVLLTLGGGVALVANWVFLFQSFATTTLTVATVSYHMEPFLLVALGAVISRELPKRKDLIWLVVAFGGLLLATRFIGVDGIERLSPSQIGGVLSALLAGLLYALATLAAKHTTGIRPYVMTLIQCVTGALLLLPFSAQLQWSGTGWWWIAAMGVIHTGLLYSALYGSARVLSTMALAALSFVNPAVAIFADIAVYGHIPDLVQLAGIVLIAVATITITVPRKVKALD